MRRPLRAGTTGLLLGALALSALAPLPVRAQGEPNPDQLKKLYEDTLNQLKQAQDRKNELAAENEKLNAKLNELQKQIDGLRTESDRLKQDAADFSERTFFLRTQYAAWKQFLLRYPKLQQRWELFLRGEILSPEPAPPIIDFDWPLNGR